MDILGRSCLVVTIVALGADGTASSTAFIPSSLGWGGQNEWSVGLRLLKRTTGDVGEEGKICTRQTAGFGGTTAYLPCSLGRSDSKASKFSEQGT